MKRLPIKEWQSRAKALWRFLSVEVWDLELSALSVRRRFGVNAVRVVQLVLRGFREDECPLHASALTFTTMMSIVPILALSLALARGLGGDEAARDWMRNRVADWTEGFESHQAASGTVAGDTATADAVVEDPVDPAVLSRQINDLLEAGFERMEQVSFGAMGGVGLVLLVWMVVAVLGQVESAFNRVWGIKEDRPLLRKFTDYLSVLFILPLLLLAATSLPIMDFATRFLDPRLASVVQSILVSGFLKNITVLVMTSLVFAFLIMFMPNTKVKLIPGLTGGLITAILFLLWLWLCAALQVGAVRMGKIYGSFATLPILLAWVSVSWQIIFLGAESAFAIQNCDTYRLEQNVPRASQHARLTLALAVVLDVARAVTAGRPFDQAEFARQYGVPVRLLLSIMDDLVGAGLVAGVALAPGQYLLLGSPDTLRVQEVLERLNQSGVAPTGLGLDKLAPAVRELAAQLAGGADAGIRGQTIREWADKIHA